MNLCRLILLIRSQLHDRNILSLIRGIIRNNLIRAVISIRGFGFLHIVAAKRNIQRKDCIAVLSALYLLKQMILLYQDLITQQNVLPCIEAEHRSCNRHFSFLIQLPGRDRNLLAFIGEGQLPADHRRILIHIGKGHCLRLCVQRVSIRRIFLAHLIAAKRKLLLYRHAVFTGCDRIHQFTFRVCKDPGTTRVLLMIRRVDIFCSADLKHSILQLLNLPGEFLSIVSGQHFAFLIHGQFSLYRMVLQCHFDHHITAHLFNQMGRVLVNGYRNSLLVERIALRCIHFLDQVLTKRQWICQYQRSFLIRKIGCMLHRERICRHLLHVTVIRDIKDLKLCIREKDRLLRLIILLDDLQLRMKLLIQKHPPDLRRIRKIL